MDFEQAKIDILSWVVDFVEKPHPLLDGWPPCPHARRARLDGQFDIVPGTIDPYADLMKADLGDFMVRAYVYDPNKFTAEKFNQLIDSVNQSFLVPRDLLALADHPSDVEIIKDVCMNQGKYAIAFLQPLGKLNQFAKQIASKGYYQGWPDVYLSELFKYRIDPRES